MPTHESPASDPVRLASSAVAVGVFRYDPGTSGSASSRELLTNVRVLSIEYREGPDPGFARFAYVLSDPPPEGMPGRFEEIFSVDSTLPGVVRNDERLLVAAIHADGSTTLLFDGFAQVPELALAGNFQEVTFSASGVAFRLWDDQIAGALMRDADRPDVASDVLTDLDVRFNPLGEPNASPEGADARIATNGPTFPTLLDQRVVRRPDVRRFWDLAMAARYLCFHENADEAFVKNPAPELLDALLVEKTMTEPPEGPPVEAISPIVVPDFVASGLAWPDALHRLIEPEGFGMAFRLEVDAQGEPSTGLYLFRRQDPFTTETKALRLQSPGSALDPALSNLAEARIVRDVTEIRNEVLVEPAPTRYEASFILSPGFAVDPADAQDADGIARFNLNHPSFAAVRNRYRLYIFDETGEGHWDWSTSTLSRTAPSLASVIGSDASGRTLRRRRTPIGELFSKDADGRQLRANLSISTDYAGPQPGLWDGSGTWQPVGGGFELTRDRLGIWINVANPNGWNIQENRTTSSPYPSGVVRGVEDQAKAGGRRFALRLTCVIEGDRHEVAKAERRDSSPTSFRRRARLDAKDRYFKHVISAHSEFNSTGSEIVVRDDSQTALAEAKQRRRSGELGSLAGSVTIPRFTTEYRVGDRIGSIQGRSLSFRLNSGAGPGESDVYPAVVGLVWDFDGEQRTTLHLSDQRANRP